MSQQFQRSRSKVWWGSNNEESPMAHAPYVSPNSVSVSPKQSPPSWSPRQGSPVSHRSHDSGFSDSDRINNEATSTSQTESQKDKETCVQGSPTVALAYSPDKEVHTPLKNFTDSCTEKYTPKKSISYHLIEQNNTKISIETHSPSVMDESNSSNHIDHSYGCMSPHSSTESPIRSISRSESPDQSYGSLSPLNHSKNNKPSLLDRILQLNYSTTSPMQGSFYYQHSSLNLTPTSSSDSSTDKGFVKRPRTKRRSPTVSRNLMSCFPIKTDLVNSNASHLEMDSNKDNSNPRLLPDENQNTEPSKETSSSKTWDSSLSPPCPYNNETYELELPSRHFRRRSEKENSSWRISPNKENMMSDIAANSNADISHNLLPYRELFPSFTSTPKMFPPYQVHPTPPTPLRRMKQPIHGMKPMNLLDTFNVLTTEPRAITDPLPKAIKLPSPMHALHLVLRDAPAPVTGWLRDLEQLCEPEAMTMLQNKAIYADMTRRAAVVASNTANVIRRAIAQAKLISNEFTTIHENFNADSLTHIAPLVQSLVGNILEFVMRSKIGASETLPRGCVQMMDLCEQIRKDALMERVNHKTKMDIALLERFFDNVKKQFINKHITVLVSMIEEPSSDMILRAALTSLVSLAGIEGYSIEEALSSAGAPRALLQVIVDCPHSTARAYALRALVTLCQTEESVGVFEKAGGFEIISDVLDSASNPEPELREAVALLVQVTAPYQQAGDACGIPSLSKSIKSIVNSITRLLESTRCCQTMLLCAAALASLSQLDPDTIITPKMWGRTVSSLLQAVRARGPGVSVFLQEQTSLFLSNVSAKTENRAAVTSAGAISAILYFLRTQENGDKSSAVIASIKRLQFQSALALLRLCVDHGAALEVVEQDGVAKLVTMCKEPRDDEDSLLVLCLGILRRIAAHCGSDVMEPADAMELLQPKLMDSYLSLSSRRESYV